MHTSVRYFLLVCCFSNIYASTSPKLVKYWADSIGEKLHKFTEDITSVRSLKEEYRSLDMKVKKVNGQVLTSKLSQKLEEFFGGKVKALRDLANNASQEEDNYIPNNEDLHYYNGKYLQGLNLTDDPSFGVAINYNASIVHIPTEVYDRGPKVARDIKWTKKLNKVFQRNFEVYPGLSWQYFGSAEGIHRQYPGRQWPHPRFGPDLYDARRRPWYIQGATSPKDVLILIDRSGSLLGVRIEIARFAAGVIIDTLTTNDFFHVVVFNNQSEFICCGKERRLMQATRNNKEYVRGRLKSLKAGNTANWNAGLTMALEILNKTRHEKEGTQCQQVLIVLSDGSVSYNKDLFTKYDPDNNIRVFTYVMGPPQYDVTEMKEMACNHKGFFLRIPSLGAVWETVTSYIRVLSRPLGLAETKPTTFTSVFVDATGSGLVSTGSIPVFKKSNSELLGVMATDIPVKDLSEFIFFPLIGHNGYVFAIDNNGLILIHPGINGRKLGNLNPQPNMDIDELEFAVSNQTQVYELRKRMIVSESGIQGNLTFETYTKSDDELRVYRDTVKYHYIRSVNSPFSIGIASPDYGIEIERPQMSYDEGIEYLQNVTRIKRWAFCSKTRLIKNLTDAIIQKLIEAEVRHERPENCDPNMINGLLIDAYATLGLPKLWNEKETVMLIHDVNIVFVRTHWGIIRTFSRINQTLPVVEKMSKKKEEDLSVSPWDFYGRAIRNPEKVTISSEMIDEGMQFSHKDSERYITIHHPIFVEKYNFTVAATGMEMNYTKFQDIFFIHMTRDCPTNKECDKRITCDRNQKNQVEGLYCYLLDENGFVVASNEQDEVGMFFGLVDGKVMSRLIEKNQSYSLYDVVTLPDYQASCKLYFKEEGSAGSSLVNPLKVIYTTFLTLIAELLTITGKLSLSSLAAALFTIKPVTSIDDESFVNVSCTKNTTIYLADGRPLLAQGNATCGNANACVRSFLISSVKKTNLYLLAIESNCGTCKDGNPKDLPGIPGVYEEKIFRGEASYTKPPKREKIRRNPSKCYPPDKENNENCGSFGKRLSISWMLIIFSFAIAEIMRQLTRN